MKIIFSCGACGCPLDADGKDIAPFVDLDKYNPNEYQHIYCNECAAEEEFQHWLYMERKREEEQLWRETYGAG